MSIARHMYLRPESVHDAIVALASHKLTILAGGTDLYASCTSHSLAEPILDISAIRELRGFYNEGEHWRVGATTTWTDVVRADLPPLFHGLQAAAREVGGIQVQNSGTVAGNVCNASPAADGMPALLALDAHMELTSLSGRRTVALSDFVVGARRVVCAPNELVTALLIPARPNARSSFIKLGHRRYLVISIAMASVVIDVGENGKISHARVAVGSCSAVARSLHSLEAKLLQQTIRPHLSDLVQPDDLSPLTPIDDVRGSREYRSDVALTLVKRAIEEAIHEQAH